MGVPATKEAYGADFHFLSLREGIFGYITGDITFAYYTAFWL